ncbi:MAG: hypothetical protein M3068_12385 [Gemmatimonadota bacterium]|nr:hypothetical protein [Gemmatimonadota bacterium]
MNGRWFNGRAFVPRTLYVSDGSFVRRRPVVVDQRLDLAGRYIVAPYGEAHNHNIEGAPPLTVKRYLDAGIFYVEDPESFGEARANAVGVLNVPTSVDATFAGGGFMRRGWPSPRTSKPQRTSTRRSPRARTRSHTCRASGHRMTPSPGSLAILAGTALAMPMRVSRRREE